MATAYKGYLYAVSSDRDARENKYKLGLTSDPVHRIRQYRTGDCPGYEKTYHALWETPARNDDELRIMEARLHQQFELNRLYRSDGGKSEWFNIPFYQIQKYFKASPDCAAEVSVSDLKSIVRQASEGLDTPAAPVTPVNTVVSEMQILTNYLKVCVPSGTLRLVQQELWDIWSRICKVQDYYTGIIQWATGVGKTVAITLTLYLSLKYHRSPRPFRALIMAQRVDILAQLTEDCKKIDRALVVISGESLDGIALPKDKPFVLLSTHAAIVRYKDKFSPILRTFDYILYDEVHRIAGEELNKFLLDEKPMMICKAFLGTSATPLTSRADQHDKMCRLFAKPGTNKLNILHACDYNRAIHEGYIARPRVRLIQTDPSTRIKTVVEQLRAQLERRRLEGQRSTGKCILYFRDTVEVEKAIPDLEEYFPEATIYTANPFPSLDRRETSSDFRDSAADGTVRILCAVQRFREGSNIYGLEVTALVGQKTVEPYILLQIIGRALRIDANPNKIGDCLIFRDKETTTETPVQILFDVFSQMVTGIKGVARDCLEARDNIHEVGEILQIEVSSETGDLLLSSKQSIEVAQKLYERNQWEGGQVSIGEFRQLVRRCPDIRDPYTYEMKRRELDCGWPEDPRTLKGWVSWYDLLFCDGSPRQTLAGFKEFLAMRTPPIRSKADYEDAAGLPPWAHLELGYLRDKPSPMNIEADIFTASVARSSRRR